MRNTLDSRVLLIYQQGVTKAHVDKRDIIADKGLIRPELQQGLKNQGLNLHTPSPKSLYFSDHECYWTIG